jgi:hypothetical protein
MPTQYASELAATFNKDYPNAVDGDGVIIFGPTDAQEVWVKSGSFWSLNEPNRPILKRVIDDTTKGGWSGQQPVIGVQPTVPIPGSLTSPGGITTSGINAGHIALFAVLGFLLLRGSAR